MQTALVLLAGSLILPAVPPPAAPPPRPQTPPAAQTPAPKPRPSAQRSTAARLTLIVQITDNVGKVLGGADVIAVGPVDRQGTTDDEGSITFRNMAAGTYRLRFQHEGSITLERDVTLQAGRTTTRITAALNPEPERPAAPPAPPPTATAPPPPAVNAQPMTVSIPDFVEKNYVGSQPMMRSPLGCTSSSTTTLIQLRDPLTEHSHADADETLYVVAGDGTHRVNGRDSGLTAGTYSLVPRGTPHAITRKGSRPLIFLSILSGPPCTAGQ